MVKKGKLISIMMALLLLVVSVPMAVLPVVPVLAATEGGVSGGFTAANVLPTVSVLEIYSDSELTTTVTNLTPQVEYYVKVTAGDANTIDDIDEIQVKIFYDADNNDPVAPGVANTQTAAIFTWDKDGGVNEWTVSAGGGTTWAITSGNSTKPGDMTASGGDWKFAIKVGKVATESAGSSNWDMYAKVTDGGGNNEIYKRDKEVLWYGEVSTSAVAAFGSVTPGTGFAGDTNEVGSISVTYIANGDYDQKVKSSATWAGTVYNATFDATGNCTNDNEFSLKAYDADTFASAVQVDTTGVSIDATGTQTGEAGNAVATNTLWLKVATPFANDTYTGTITYIIADR